MKMFTRFNALFAAVLGMALGFGTVATAQTYYGPDVVGNRNVLPGALITAGTQPVLSGCPTISAQTGGATAGKFVTSGTACALVITLPAAPNGYICFATDLTNAVVTKQASTTATSCTFTSFVTVGGDTILFQAIGY